MKIDHLTPIDVDNPLTFVELIDDTIARSFGRPACDKLSQLELPYIDDAISHLKGEFDLSELFYALNRALSSRNLLCYHATRLSESDQNSIEEQGFKPLLATERLAQLITRIDRYCEQNDITYQTCDLEMLVQKFKGRDNGQVFFGLSRNFHLKDCPEYLHFGSEFEAVIVVHLLGRHHRKLLKQGNKAAFVVWEISAKEAIEETTHREISDRLAGGNYPEFAAHLLNPWLLWKTGRSEDCQYLNADFSLTFTDPFPRHSQTIALVAEHEIIPYGA